MTITPGFDSGDIILGTITTEERPLRVSVRIRYEAREAVTATTTDHREIPMPPVLSIQGDVTDPRRPVNGWVSAGQVGHWVTQIGHAAGTLSAADLVHLFRIWETWHLNTMQAACDHMDLSTVPADLPAYSAERGKSRSDWMLDNLVCPETGYRYGRSWLVKEVPADVLTDLEEIIARARA